MTGGGGEGGYEREEGRFACRDLFLPLSIYFVAYNLVTYLKPIILGIYTNSFLII